MNKSVYISLGSNMGSKRENLAQAVELISNIPGVKLKNRSSLYETEPWGKTDQDKFLNQVIEIETSLPPRELLKELQDIEINMGRQRKEKWGPRIIDLDILLYGNEVLDDPQLAIPHPRMRERLFVLVPLAEIGADLRFPDNGATVREVLSSVLAREGNRGIERV
ncbi:MAG TPA: 2-amino-4-hydroxy-6-hydroxymethyldihydropteridine diphosphokinase [Syntrophomonadaceae bacterium]|nr:2-amino-4-hydroxy-6-hydroxymethyldihydropteridine diphosphokinase [Syntrophomonadaceae bacterium]HOQ10184.1 2-amino-4-hydroxy-6-hydroxymethyldihydropteridine diphosphokinase [Syntrophomonadaceae bacterium]HPU49773.1 2-amino-4-hydroxy-6-hydroxymethyldihydropteridine diphosphokinase [Syntrophomonadaceae bacterium]